MKNVVKKTFIIFCLILIVGVIALATVGYLLNHGKFTRYVEKQVNKQIDGEVKFETVFLDIFSGITLKGVSFSKINENEDISFRCKSLKIKGKISDLLTLRIKKIAINDPTINVNLDKTDTFLTGTAAPLNGTGDVHLDLKDILPEKLFIGEFSINNINAHITTFGYQVEMSKTNLHIKDIQISKPLKISFNGNIKIANNLNSESLSISAGIGVEADYSLLRDELTILGNSYILLNNMGKFNMNGKVLSVTSEPDISCNLKSQSFALNNIPDILKDFDFADISPITLEGKCDIDIFAKGKLDKITLESNSVLRDLNVTYEDFIYKSKEFELRTETVISAMVPTGHIASESKFTIPKSRLLVKEHELAEFHNLPFVVTMEYPEAMRISLGTIDGKINMDQQSILIDDLITNSKIEIGLKDVDNMPYRCEINTTVSDPVIIKGEYNYDTETIRDTNINISNMSCNGLFRKFRYLMPEDYKDWSCNGNITLLTTIDTGNGNSSKQELDMVTNLSFSDVEFASPEYDYFGEGINGKIRLNVKSNYDFDRFFFKVNGKIDPFLISLGDFSTDMRNRVTEFSAESLFDSEKDLLSEIDGTLLYDDIGSFVLNGTVTDISNTPGFEITLQLKDLSNATFFETFIKDTIEYSSPQFFNADIGGASNAYFNLSGNLDAMQIDGRVNVDDGHMKFEDTSIEGLYLDFPLSITYPKAIISSNYQDVPDNKYGSIEIKKLSYNFIDIDNFKVKPLVEGNNFLISEPIEIPIFDGTIFVKDIFVEDVVNPDMDINFSFQLSNIDLEKVSNAANLTPFEGNLDTSLIAFKQQGKKLFSEGEMKFTLFGGDIIINNLMLTDFMSTLMGIEFSAEVNHLDLGQMSNTFREWGNVGGIINGKMNNFRIVAGEPSSFDIELRTEKKRGVKQVVSANFLKSFVPGIASVLDTFGFTSYNYAVMGLQAKLENDYVTFKGAVRDEGKELFMKGAGLKKLDIVFNNVDKNIKFSRFLGSFESIMKSNFEETKVEAE